MAQTPGVGQPVPTQPINILDLLGGGRPGGSNPLGGHTAAVGGQPNALARVRNAPDLGPTPPTKDLTTFKAKVGRFFKNLDDKIANSWLGRAVADKLNNLGSSFGKTVGGTAQRAAQNALNDPDLSRVARSGKTYGTAVSFFQRHFDAIADPKFWSQHGALMNTDNFGAGMTFAVLDRVTANGELTNEDVRHLNRALDPEAIPKGNVQQRLPSTITGPLNDQAKNTIAQNIYDCYVKEGAETNSINISYATRSQAAEIMSDPNATADDKLKMLRQCFAECAGNQYFSESNLRDPLKAVLG